MGYQSAPDGFNPKFTGQHRDTENFLDYFHARYYSPEQGRFVSADPGNAGADPVNPQTWNGYAYVGNNPLNVTDPSGRSWLTGLFGALGFIGGFFTAGLTEIPWIVGIMAGAEVAGAQYSFEKAANSGNIAAIAGVFLGGPHQFPDYGGGFIFDVMKNGREVMANGDVAIYGQLGQGGPILKAAGERAAHDSACVIPGFSEGMIGSETSAVGSRIWTASHEPWGKSVGGGRIGGNSLENSSWAAKWARDNLPRFKLPRWVPSPVGTRGVDLRSLPAKDTAALAGRLAPYVGPTLKWFGRGATAVGAVMTWHCISQE